MNDKELVVRTTEEFLKKMGFTTQVSWVDNSGLNIPIVVVAASTDSGMLIGKQGETLDCIERLVRLVVLRSMESHEARSLPHFIIDVNGYRRAQAEQLIRAARETAKKVAQSKRVESLAPMTAYERRLIHADLASFGEVETESVGSEPQRRIIVKPISSLGI